jgi:CBS domain-containing protein
MYAQEIMVEPIITCQSTESLADAARKLWDHDCGALPIVNDEGILVGMLTDRDICMAALTQGKLLPDMAIPHAMSKVVYAVTATTPVREVKELMAVQQIRRVPVVDAKGKPIGIITANDLIRAASRSGEGMTKVLQTMASICHPRSELDRAA